MGKFKVIVSILKSKIHKKIDIKKLILNIYNIIQILVFN